MTLFKKVDGVEVPASAEDIAQRAIDDAASAQEKLIPSVKQVNETLETVFLSVLPKHIGQPYLTPQVMLSIASLKQSVTDFNRLGLYALSKQMIEGIDLPVEMAADKQTLVNLFP